MLIHRALAGHDGNDPAGARFINRLRNKIIVDPEIVTVICAVIDAIATKGHIPNDDVKHVVWKGRVLKAFYLHVHLRIEFCCDFSGDTIKLYAIELCISSDLFRHVLEEVSGSHCRFKRENCPADAHAAQSRIDTRDDLLGRVESI